MFPAFFVTLRITVFHSVLVDPTLIASNQYTILGAKGCHSNSPTPTLEVFIARSPRLCEGPEPSPTNFRSRLTLDLVH